MRDDSAFLGKTLGMLLFFFEKRFRYKKREVSVLMACRLEHIVQCTLHLFPDRVTIRFDHHTAAHGAVLGQTGAFHDLVVPLGIILRSFWKGFAHITDPLCSHG